MKRYERTARKPTMIKAVHHAMQSSSDLLALCAKYWNELANGYYLEYKEVHFDAGNDAWVESEDAENSYSTVDDFCDEASYWLSCYYEGGHCRHEEEYAHRKAFIKFLDVFKPFCKEKHTKWIPYIEETKFLFE
jgi:hypothetical protein